MTSIYLEAWAVDRSEFWLNVFTSGVGILAKNYSVKFITLIVSVVSKLHGCSGNKVYLFNILSNMGARA